MGHEVMHDKVAYTVDSDADPSTPDRKNIIFLHQVLFI